jgi:hypothetical protein
MKSRPAYLQVKNNLIIDDRKGPAMTSKHIIQILMPAALLLLLTRPVPAQVKVIFDTDMDTDCDDAGALAMLHALADAGETEILATVVSSKYRWSVPCAAAINAWYGRPDLPVGCPKGEGAPTNRGSRYARKIAEAFPTRFKTNDDAPSAVEVYRRVLAAQPAGSVVVVTVGYLTNLRDLLDSGPDRHSRLAGPDLVRRHVKRWVCMGGRYPQHLKHGNYGNFMPDPRAAVEAATRWPTPVFFSGLGEKVRTGKGLGKTPAGNPVRRVYELYLGDRPTRSSWDQVALLYAIRQNAPFWRVREDGYNHIFKNGTNQWRDKPDKNHCLVTFPPEQREKVTAVIEGLMIRPPARGKKQDP